MCDFYLSFEASERVSRYSHMITWFKSVSDLLDVKPELATQDLNLSYAELPSHTI